MQIECLWVNVTVQVGAAWADHFVLLELQHGLDINNVNHIWLLHFLFLPTINQQLTFFAESWNCHRIQIRNGPNRSPADMFGFDMLVHGLRGHQLSDKLSEEELEVYGIDWEALYDEGLLQSQQVNNSGDEESTSWIGRTGPPQNLNEVAVESRIGPLRPDQVESLTQSLSPWMGRAEDTDIINLWTHGLAYAREMYPDLF